MPVMRHCTSGCRGGRATFIRQEYVLLSTKMETASETNYALTNAVVTL